MNGVLFTRGISANCGVLYFPRSKNKLLRTIGQSILTASLIGLLLSLWPIAKNEFTRLPKEIVNQNVVAQEHGFAAVEAESLGLNPYFSINIPKISAKADILANVDPGNSKEYGKALSVGVAHAKGTYFPGQNNTIFLFAHSTDSPLNFSRFNAVFYLLNKLEPGDTISIFFLNNKYTYIVENKLIVAAQDVSWLKNKGQELLVLQTCDPPGTSLRRLLVLAKPI